MQFLSFCDGFIELSIIVSRFTHVVANVRISFLFMAEQYSTMWIYHVDFAYPFICGWTWVVSTLWLL